MRLETDRLILRPFSEQDAADTFAYCKDPRVGPPAGWPPHKSLEETLEIIRTVFSQPHVFAVVERESGRVIGSVGFVGRHRTELPGPDEEVGYALSPEFWGRGLMPEAVREILRYGFEQLELETIWCGCYEWNQKSRRVAEKCGFQYRLSDSCWVEAVGEMCTELHYAITREMWEERQADDELLNLLFSLTT
jgi:ribosomal-protein-alanine N-acetyltransferase